MNVQVVAFPQDGVGGRTEALMREALELGADVVGGIPWIERDEGRTKSAYGHVLFARERVR